LKQPLAPFKGEVGRRSPERQKPCAEAVEAQRESRRRRSGGPSQAGRASAIWRAHSRPPVGTATGGSL